LAEHQLEIEKRLFQHMGQEAKIIYLYDVTSSYLEGTKRAENGTRYLSIITEE